MIPIGQLQKKNDEKKLVKIIIKVMQMIIVYDECSSIFQLWENMLLFQSHIDIARNFYGRWRC